MKIIASYFNRKKNFNKLIKAFQNSIKYTMPNIKHEIYKIEPPEYISGKHDTAYCSLDTSNRILKSKELSVACDIDLMFLKSIEDIENYDFDIAITVREHKHYYNSGIWFFNPNDRSRKFVQRWIDEKLKVMNNTEKYKELILKHGGMNQASLSLAIDELKDKVKIIELPCQEWNATQSEWEKVDKNTRVVHIKSNLRKYCLKKSKISEENKHLKDLVKKWRSYLNE